MQKPQRLLTTLSVLAAAATLAACANQPLGYPQGQAYPQAYPQGQTYPQGQVAYAGYGRVTNVEYMRGGQQPTDGVTGAVIGGAVGGLAGSQVGGGRGRTAATVAGVVGGALIGRALEQNMNRGPAHDYYRVTVQFDNGGVQTFDYADAPNVRVGDRVRAEGNQLYR